jgi:hypothetical protein
MFSKHLWIAYSQDREYAYVLFNDMILVIYLLWYNYLDKYIAECCMQ